jgi:type I restriction enzyme R subunit
MHTSTFFGRPLYEYGYNRAVSDGFLVDYDEVKIASEIALKGHFLHEGEEVGLRDTTTGQLKMDFVEDERELPAGTLERDWTAPAHNRKVVEVGEASARARADLGHFPRRWCLPTTICPTAHADQLVRMLRRRVRTRREFVQKITGSPASIGLCRRSAAFAIGPSRHRGHRRSAVHGVDIPALENIVFLRGVKSRILFEQMLGRGTRKCEAIYKTHFTVFDGVGVLEYFRRASEFTFEPPAKPTRPNREVVEAIYNNQDRDYNVRVLVKRLQRVAKNISAKGRELARRYIPDGDFAFARALAPTAGL